MTWGQWVMGHGLRMIRLIWYSNWRPFPILLLIWHSRWALALFNPQ